jgi:hypothetical protein
MLTMEREPSAADDATTAADEVATVHSCRNRFEWYAAAARYTISPQGGVPIDWGNWCARPPGALILHIRFVGWATFIVATRTDNADAPAMRRQDATDGAARRCAPRTRRAGLSRPLVSPRTPALGTEEARTDRGRAGCRSTDTFPSETGRLTIEP